MRSARRRVCGIGAVALVAAGCSSGAGLPDPVSAQGDHVLSLWRLLLVASIVLGAVVLGALLWSIVRYRARGDDTLPPQVEGHVPLELVAAGIPLLVVAGLFAAILVTLARQDAESEGPAVVVEVTAFRWGWRFHYPSEDVTVSGGPGENPTLVLPVDRNVRLELASADVVHSFFVPGFLTKRDVFPDDDGTLDVRPTETGELVGHCAEFCGLDHARMDFVVRVEDESDFEAWLDEQAGAT